MAGTEGGRDPETAGTGGGRDRRWLAGVVNVPKAGLLHFSPSNLLRYILHPEKEKKLPPIKR